MLDDFARDTAHGARVLWQNPGFAAVVLATLTFGIGATVTVFSVVDAWLLKPLAFPKAEQLVIGLAARRERPTEPAVFLLYRDYLGWKERSRSFDGISATFPRSYLITGRGDATTARGMVVTEEFFSTLGVSPALGRTLSAGDGSGPAAVVLSHGLWQRQFGGSADAIGTHITLNGAPHEVVGVMPREFDVRMLEQARGYELWTVLKAGEPGYAAGGTGPVAIFGRLRAGVTAAAAQAELATIQRDIESQYAESLKEFVVLLTSLQADNTRTVRATLVTVAGAVACLLLIACLNVGALLVGRAFTRVREAAIRVAIGCNRGRLVRQLLAESLLMSLIGGICGVLLALAATRLFASWDPLGTLPAAGIRIDLRALAFSAVVMAIVTVACGVVPALRLAATDPSEALRSGGERGPAGPPTQGVQVLLLSGQISISLVLLVATTLLVRTFLRLQTEPLGFEAAELTVGSLALPADEFDSPAKRNAFFARLAEGINALPGVHRVAAGTSPPLFSGGQVSVRTGADYPGVPHRFSAQDVTAEFFETLGIPLITGRAFDVRDSSAGAPVVVLNERAAQMLFGSPGDAVRRQIRLDSQGSRQVIGVVGNTRSTFFNTLEWLTNPVVYLPAPQAFGAVRDPTVRSFDLHVHIRADRPVSMKEFRNAMAAFSSNVAVIQVRTASSAIAEATKQPTFRMTLLGSFAVASLLLAAIGVYGLVSQAVTRRTREVGIRIALGAGANDIIRTVARQALVAGIAGSLVGSIAGFAVSNALKAVLYGARAGDFSSFASSSAVLLAVTAVAALVPAIRATRINPIHALRSD